MSDSADQARGKKSKHGGSDGDSHKHGGKHSGKHGGGAPLSDHPVLFDAVSTFLRGATPVESGKRIDEVLASVGDARGPDAVFEAALRHGRLALGLDAAWRFAFFLAEASTVAEELGEPSFGAIDLNRAHAAVAAECDLGVAALISEGFPDDSSDEEDDADD